MLMAGSRVAGKGATIDEGPSATVSLSDNTGGGNSIPATSSIQSSIRHHNNY